MYATKSFFYLRSKKTGIWTAHHFSNNIRKSRVSLYTRVIVEVIYVNEIYELYSTILLLSLTIRLSLISIIASLNKHVHPVFVSRLFAIKNFEFLSLAFLRASAEECLKHVPHFEHQTKPQ